MATNYVHGSLLYQQRIAHLMANGAPAGWTGVEVLTRNEAARRPRRAHGAVQRMSPAPNAVVGPMTVV
ncbi:hypothetical protein predicted by Glimmer/Critica [Sorangium cellulosum So ce56]|uniref:Uncharacterized protein n=1 Tax=Sorangium cellulosum (strain So ce56) TaxID=448385 RepID=A9FKH6_SORC5|nr:hypothetical protein predicted by Glimmer/Critica [Sorangium cellulosum So ce56]